MKRLIIMLLASMTAVGALAGPGEIKVTITDSRGKSLRNLEVYTYVKGTEEVTVNPPTGELTVENPADGDTLAVIVGNTIYEIPIGDAGSVHIYMKNRNRFEGYSLDGGEKVTGANSYPVESEPWVKGAVDHATSYMYTDLLSYIEARIPSVRPIRTRMGGTQLTINGNRGRPALLVVDGTEFPSFEILNASYRPWEIKSIRVDRTGTLYGLRGSNGVIHFETMPLEEQ